MQRGAATTRLPRSAILRCACCLQVFVGGTVSYAYTCIPTYPSGQIGFMLCSKAGDAADFVTPHRPPPVSGAVWRGRLHGPPADTSPGRPEATALLQLADPQRCVCFAGVCARRTCCQLDPVIRGRLHVGRRLRRRWVSGAVETCARAARRTGPAAQRSKLPSLPSPYVPRLAGL